MALTDVLTDIKSRLNALVTYANGVTGASDTSVGDAVRTLAAGYGQGGSGKSLEEIYSLDYVVETSDTSAPSTQITIASNVDLSAYLAENCTLLAVYEYVGTPTEAGNGKWIVRESQSIPYSVGKNTTCGMCYYIDTYGNVQNLNTTRAFYLNISTAKKLTLYRWPYSTSKGYCMAGTYKIRIYKTSLL